MKKCVFLFGYLGLSLAVAAQNAASKAVQVAADTSASPVVVRWAEGAPGSSSTVQNGMRIESQRSGSILIKISPLTNVGENFTQTWVGILNSGPGSITFDPDKASVEVIKPKAKNLAALHTGTAAKAIKNAGESSAQVLATTGLQGNLNCTPEQLVNGCLPPGSGATTQAAKDQIATSTEQSQWARQNGLTARDLETGSSVQGAVFFHREKQKEYVVRIPIGNYVFEFPFGPNDLHR